MAELYKITMESTYSDDNSDDEDGYHSSSAGEYTENEIVTYAFSMEDALNKINPIITKDQNVKSRYRSDGYYIKSLYIYKIKPKQTSFTEERVWKSTTWKT